ncbi:hypothetical protein DL96DRAFT_1572749 [Flagelloscypha sp. PMI_526]|nr:hypothetical protein DL96DRAFT_1572749 [Flagelloscypha sp. PMI_526]
MAQTETDSLSALMPLMLVVGVIIIAAILWCMLTSCLGTPLRRSFSNLWEHLIMSAEAGRQNGRRTTTRTFAGEDELFEMESRGRYRT